MNIEITIEKFCEVYKFDIVTWSHIVTLSHIVTWSRIALLTQGDGHPICPVMMPDERTAVAFADEMLSMFTMSL